MRTGCAPHDALLASAMPRARILPSLFIAFTTGCAPGAATTSPPPAPPPSPLCVSAVSSPPVAASPPAADNPCAKIYGEQRRHLASLAPQEADGGTHSWVPPIFTRCYRSKKGAWGLAAEFVTFDVVTSSGEGEGLPPGNWYVLHVDERGVLATSLALLARRSDNVLSSYPSYMTWKEPVLFDFDGDGEDEFVVTGTDHVHEGGVQVFGQAWTVTRKGYPPESIQQYELRGGFDTFYDVIDFDGDGRPDLVTHGLYEADSTLHTCSSFHHVDYGPPLLAHSLKDGAFSTEDAVAARYALRSCPQRPASLLEPAPKGASPAEPALLNVICARLWGASEAAVVKMIKTECGLPAPPGACVEAGPAMIKQLGPPPKCGDAEGMLRWAKLRTLVQLKP
jgi:hypothetical protein